MQMQDSEVWLLLFLSICSISITHFHILYLRLNEKGYLKVFWGEKNILVTNLI